MNATRNDWFHYAVVGVTSAVLMGILAISSGCSPQQQATAQADAVKVQQALNAGCATYAQTAAVVNATPVGLTPQAQVIEGFASGACVGAMATDVLVQKALSDPNTQSWLAGLSTQLAAVKG